MGLLALVIGRILLAIIFIVSGITKLQTLDQTGAMIASAGLPANLAMPTGVFELVAGAALAVGVLPRLVPLLLAGFTLLTILFFHANVSDPMQAIQAMKNVAIIGGLFAVLAASHERRSYRVVQTAPVRDSQLDAAEDRAHAAELRSERAEAQRDPGDRHYVHPDERVYPDDMPPAPGDVVPDRVSRYPVRRPWFRRWF